MQTQVHSKKFVIDQWTGESFEAELKFKIPHKGLRIWKGCYGSPSTALAGLMNYFNMEKNLEKDEMDELLAVFQSSLKKTDPNDKYPHFTINAAPSYYDLESFGGAKTLSEFHQIYGHDIQREIYSQIIVHDIGEDEEDNSSSKSSSPPTRQWTMVKFPQGKCSDFVVEKTTMPRCSSSWLDFLVGMTDYDTPNAIVVYFNPKDDKMFAVGSPKDWNVKLNKKAGDLFGKIPMFGEITVFSKHEVKDLGGSSSSSSSSNPDPPRKKVKKEKKGESHDASTQTI